MSEYLYGCDVLGADDGSFSEAVSSMVQVEKPLAVERAHVLISAAINALAEMNFYDTEEDTMVWRDDMAAQLARMEEMIDQSGVSPLPDKATDVLCAAISTVAEMIDEGTEIYPQLERTKDNLFRAMGAGIQVLGSNALVIIEPHDGADAVHMSIEDVLGDMYTIIGMFDIGAAQRQMNALKPVTVGIAKSLVHGGQQVISAAQIVSMANSLPDTKTLATTAGHLQWHVDKLAGLKDDKAIYASGDDAKKWTMQAFIESNAVEEGAAYLDEAWSKMWQEITTKLAEIPRTLAKIPSQVFEAVTGVPPWALYVGVIGLVGLVGYGAFRILAGPAGGAVVGHYLGGRR